MTPLLKRLLDRVKVDPVTACWNYEGGNNNCGYGMIRTAPDKMRTTHRVSYEEHKGPIPPGNVVCHSCDNPKCVNPDHLWTGTRKDNVRDMMEKGRHNFVITKGWKQKRRVCEHCNKDVAVNIYALAHGDKCKSKT